MSRQRALPAPIVPDDLWRELYVKAREFQQLAPWEWMDDTHLLGISNEHGVRLISVLGAIKEVFGFASYRGSVGANYLLRLLKGEISPEGPHAGYGQRALLVDFVPRGELRKEDKAIIKRIGFQPAAGSPRLFPEFYSHEPGLVPWFIDETEARLLLDDLARLIPFATLVQSHPGGYEAAPEGHFAFFPEPFTEPLTWGQLDWRVVTTEPDADYLAIDPARFDPESLRGLPQDPGAVWELSTAYSNARIIESPRPFWAKLALAVDGHSGHVIQFHLGGRDDRMAQAAAQCLIQSIQAVGVRPGTVAMDSSELGQAVAPLLTSLKIRLLPAKQMPLTAEARAALEVFNQQG